MHVESSRLEQLLEVYKGLVEVSALINGITESTELMPAILEVAQRVLHVEAASIFLVQPEGDLQLASASGAGVPSTLDQKIVVPRGRGISGWVLEHGTPLLIKDAYADPRFYPGADQQTGFRTRSILCVPLVRNGKEIGVLQVLNPIGRLAFDQSDLEAFMAYGALAATAIDKLRTVAKQAAQERLTREYGFANEIQASFLPQKLPEIAGVQFAAAYRPALNVGGDFYDVIALGPDEIYFVVGDVSGKGIPAALLMAQALSILRMILKPGISPASAMERWNAMLSGHTIRGMFVTALIGRIICSTRHVEMCSAGHCHPFHVSAQGLPLEVLIAGSPPLGLLPKLPGRSHSLTLAPDEWLVMFTDGLIESFDADNNELGALGVTRLLTPHFQHSADVVYALQTGESEHRQHSDPHDDLTVLVFGFK